MKKNVAFTIVAKNYIGLAQILEKSLFKYNNDVDFFIIVADEFSNDLIKETLPANILIAHDCLDFSVEQWSDLTFKYDLTEFCTSIKPASFLYFLEKTKYEKIIYFDPDIYIFSSLNPIFESLETVSIILTPHITTIQPRYKGDLPETSLLGSGVFNLGFCGIRRSKTSKKMLYWWHERLLDKCFIDPYNYYFTDQKWMDLLPCFFTNEDVQISRHLGMNIAPWNFFERLIFLKNGQLRVTNREDDSESYDYPVIFVHYSGYNYSEMKKGNIVQNNIDRLKSYQDIELLTNAYCEAIAKDKDLFDRYIKEKYSYGAFESGHIISKFHRRIYRSLVEKNVIFLNPFAVSLNSFYQELKYKGMIENEIPTIGKINRDNLHAVEGKLKIFNVATRLLFKLIGIKRYSMIIRLFGPFSRYESQIHLFDSRFDKTNIKR